MDGRADAGGEIHARMIGRRTGEGIKTNAEAAGAARLSRLRQGKVQRGGVHGAKGAHVIGGALDTPSEIFVDIEDGGEGPWVLRLDQGASQGAIGGAGIGGGIKTSQAQG